MFLLTSQFMKILVHVDNLNITDYPLQIKDPSPFVMCGSCTYTDAISIILHGPHLCLFINEIIISISYSFSQARFLCLCLHFYFV